MSKPSRLHKIYQFYVTGFQELSPWAKTLWTIILIKLFVMFVVFKLFFFRDTLENRFSTNEERANFVIEQITTPKQ